MSRPLDGYPDSWGATKASVLPHTGPASYTQLVPGTPPAAATGGDRIQAVSAGLKWIDFVVGGLSDSGVYRVETVPAGRSGGPQGQQKTYYTLRWVVVATGAEAAALLNLSAEVVRLLVIGPK